MNARSQENPALPGSLKANSRLSQWIEITPNGRITIRTGKVEIGQGILTALSQIAADELDVALWRVGVRSASTDISPNEGVTSGSRSITESGLALRHVCAAARSIFISVAAQKTGVPPESIRIEDGTFIGPGGPLGSYWALAESRLLECDVPAEVVPKSPSARVLAGTEVKRLDLPDKVFGRPRFIHDIRLPNMRFARVMRPPARVRRLLATPKPLDGAQVVVDGNFVAVVCPSEAEANAAAEKLAVSLQWEIEPSLPEQSELRAFLRRSPAERSTVVKCSEPQQEPAHRHRAEYFRPYLAHASIGLCCAIAAFDNGALEVWSHSQSIFALRNDLARVLGLSPEQVIVHHAEGAGCYGHNGADDVALDAALVARAMPGTAVRLQWSREDELGWPPFSSAILVEVEADTDSAGDLIAWRHNVISHGHMLRPDNFASPSLLAAAELKQPFVAPIAKNPPQASGGGADRNAIPLYRVGNLNVDLACVQLMPLRTSSLRGLGAMLNVLAIESTMDELARAVRRDPIEYRLAHLNDARAQDTIRVAAELAA